MEEAASESDVAYGTVRNWNSGDPAFRARRAQLASELDAATKQVEIRRRIGDPVGIAHALEGLAALEEFRGAWTTALEIRREAVTLARAEPNYASVVEVSMAVDYLHLGRSDEAFSCLRAVIHRIDLHDDLGLFSEIADVLAIVTGDRGEYVLATKLLGAGAAIGRLSGLSPSALYEVDTLSQQLSAALPKSEFERELALWSACSLDEAHELVMKVLLLGFDGPNEDQAG